VEKREPPLASLMVKMLAMENFPGRSHYK